MGAGASAAKYAPTNHVKVSQAPQEQTHDQTQGVQLPLCTPGAQAAGHGLAAGPKKTILQAIHGKGHHDGSHCAHSDDNQSSSSHPSGSSHPPISSHPSGSSHPPAEAPHIDSVSPPLVAKDTKSSLAARRGAFKKSASTEGSGGVKKLKPLIVNTAKRSHWQDAVSHSLSAMLHPNFFHHDQHSDGSRAPRNHLRITSVVRIADQYTIGDIVMPAGQVGAEVRHAVRVKDGRHVVVKTRCKSTSFGTKTEEGEWRESTEFMMNLPKSGSIAQLYEVLEDHKMYYVVMEHIEGVDLSETVHMLQGHLPVGECRAIIKQVLVAVADLHRKGIIHKDLKLENIMIDRGPAEALSPSARSPVSTAPDQSPEASPRVMSPGFMSPGMSPEPVVKLIDFDTAVEIVESRKHEKPKGDGAHIQHTDSHTRKKKRRSQSVVSVVGTDQYIAQEAYAGKYSPASDIFAVGVVLYRVLTGRFPFNPALFDDAPGENYVGSPKMREIQLKLRQFEIDWACSPFGTEPLALDLCKSMLAKDGRRRPSADQALQHPWITEGLEATISSVVTVPLHTPPCSRPQSANHAPEVHEQLSCKSITTSSTSMPCNSPPCSTPTLPALGNGFGGSSGLRGCKALPKARGGFGGAPVATEIALPLPLS